MAINADARPAATGMQPLRDLWDAAVGAATLFGVYSLAMHAAAQVLAVFGLIQVKTGEMLPPLGGIGLSVDFGGVPPAGPVLDILGCLIVGVIVTVLVKYVCHGLPGRGSGYGVITVVRLFCGWETKMTTAMVSTCAVAGLIRIVQEGGICRVC